MKKLIPILALLVAGAACASDLGSYHAAQVKAITDCDAAADRLSGKSTQIPVTREMFEVCAGGLPLLPELYQRGRDLMAGPDREGLQVIESKFERIFSAKDDQARRSARADFDAAWARLGY